MLDHLKWLTLLLVVGCANPADDGVRTTETREESERSGKTAGQSDETSQELTVAKARKLIPKAASLSHAELQDLFDRPPVMLDDIENQSLTALLLAIDPEIAQQQNPKSRKAFRYIGFPLIEPKPAAIRDALVGDGETDYASIIRPEYITDCTCETRGDTAEGRVVFRAEGLYAGETNFTAKRTGDEWRIVAFHVPEYLLVTKWQPDGSWKLATEDSLLGVAFL